MSVLSSYLAWFGTQSLSMQIGSTAIVFGLLFVFGLYTLGLGPLVVGGAVLLEHWYRTDSDLL